MIALAQVVLCVVSVIVILPSPLASARARKTTIATTIPCPPFPHVSLEHGTITPIASQKYFFKCDPGYFLASPDRVRCWKGKWTPSKEPKCSKVEGLCEDPPSVTGGKILGEERHEGSVIQYLCDPGFFLLGDGQRTCLRSGDWSGIVPTCMEESEPIQKVAERLKDKFVTKIGSYSSDSVVPQGRLLDVDSIKHGLELVILIDRSSSVDPEDFKLGISFIKFLLNEFGLRNGVNEDGTRAAVMAFGSKVDILFNLDNATIMGPEAASRALDTLQPGGGGTAMEQALMSVFTRLPPLRELAKKALFMITDGEPNVGELESTLFFAKELKQDRDFEIFAVGIGKGINRQLLAKIASEPLYSHLFIMDKYSNLRNVMEAVKDNPSRPKPINPARCGYIKQEKNYLKHWPWLAAVYVNLPDKSNATRLSFCSGTLICSQWIITAASCFFYAYENNATGKEFKKINEGIFIVMGERNVLEEDRNQMNFYAESVWIHPDFEPLNSVEHNLALVKLNIPAPMRRFRPACLPPSERPVLLHRDLKTNASIAGWGLRPSLSDNINREVTGGLLNSRSSNVSVALEEENVCFGYGGKKSNENIFCAGGLGSLTCIGDLGSPIIAVDPFTSIHHLIGVLSGRSHCEKGVNQYTDLTKYAQWITETTNGCHSEHYMV